MGSMVAEPVMLSCSVHLSSLLSCCLGNSVHHEMLISSDKSADAMPVWVCVSCIYVLHCVFSDHCDNHWLRRHCTTDMDGQDCSLMFFCVRYFLFCFACGKYLLYWYVYTEQ